MTRMAPECARATDEMTDDLQDNTNDATFHVARLLKEQVGATRQRLVRLTTLPLTDELTAHDVAAGTRLTRIPTGVLATGAVTATVTLDCIRCLEAYEQGVSAEFADEYRPTIDIVTGLEVASEIEGDEEEYFVIDALHIVDVTESLRQAILLALPMAPHCREDCPGIADHDTLNERQGDDRLAVLGRLLESTEETVQPPGVEARS